MTRHIGRRSPALRHTQSSIGLVLHAPLSLAISAPPAQTCALHPRYHSIADGDLLALRHQRQYLRLSRPLPPLFPAQHLRAQHGQRRQQGQRCLFSQGKIRQGVEDCPEPRAGGLPAVESKGSTTDCTTLCACEQFKVLRQNGTEPAFTSEHETNYKEGVYNCAACDTPLYKSGTKFKVRWTIAGWRDGKRDVHAVRASMAHCPLSPCRVGADGPPFSTQFPAQSLARRTTRLVW